MTGETMKFNDYNLFNTINSPESREAITLFFNGGTMGLVYTDILIYLVLSYLKLFSNKETRELLETYDGYMVKTPKDVSFHLGPCPDVVRGAYKGLEAKGLISIKKQGQDNRTCLKVNLDVVENLLDEFLPKVEERNREESELYQQRKEVRKQQREKNFKDSMTIKDSDSKEKKAAKMERLRRAAEIKAANSVDFDTLNEISEENNPSELKMVSYDLEILTLIYVFNHYYKRYTGTPFKKWDLVKLNTLLQNWRGRSDREGTELGMSVAIFKELNNESFNGEVIPFEVRVRSSFSPDIRVTERSKKDFYGVYFDDILKVNPSYKEFFNKDGLIERPEEKKNDTSKYGMGLFYS